MSESGLMTDFLKFKRDSIMQYEDISPTEYRDSIEFLANTMNQLINAGHDVNGKKLSEADLKKAMLLYSRGLGELTNLDE